MWRAPARTTLDDTGLLDQLQQAALLQRLDAGRGVGPREVAGVVEELRAIHDESRNARINKTYVLPYIALVPTAASTITDVMLAMRDLREAARGSCPGSNESRPMTARPEHRQLNGQGTT